MMKRLLFVLYLSLFFKINVSFADPNWPSTLQPGTPEHISGVNSTLYKLSGYCVAGGGDVTIDFGSLSFVVPCKDGLGAYEYEGDVSSEVTTNPIQQCVSQGVVTSICSSPVSNYLAPPDVAFDVTPLLGVNSLNVLTYPVGGDCAPVGASISVDIDGHVGIVSGVCSANHNFVISGDTSAIDEGAGLPITLTLQSGAWPAVQISSTLDKDTGPPVVSINTNLFIDPSNVTAYVVSGACSENDEDVIVDIGGINPSPQPVCTGGVWTANATDVSALLDGEILVTADHFNNLGDGATQVNFIAFKDVSAPVVVVLSAADIHLSNVSSYSASGTCSEDGDLVDVSVGGVVPATDILCLGNLWSFTGLDVSGLPEGTVSIVAGQTDDVLNVGQDIVSVTKDTTVL